MDLNNGVYCFYLEYYVYVKILKDRVLLLNTLDFNYIISYNVGVVVLCDKLLNNKEFRAVEIDFSKEYNDECFHAFFADVKKKYMGDLIRSENYKYTPFQFNSSYANILNISSFISDKGIDYNRCKNSLINLNIYLNSKCNNSCSDCSLYYKQFLSCSKSVDGEFLSVDLIDKILGNNIFSNLTKINLICGDVKNYMYWHILIKKLKFCREKFYLILNCMNLSDIPNYLLDFFEDRIIILIDVSLTTEDNIERLICKYHNFEFRFIVRTKKNLDLIVNLISDKDDIDYLLLPFLTFDNMDFFVENIFLEKEDLLCELQSLKQLHRNQVLNSSFFGGFFIYPNGDIYSNLNDSIRGNLFVDTMIKIISNELNNHDSFWFKTRNKTTCANCLFTDLCPAISNYEIVSNKYDFCTINSN